MKNAINSKKIEKVIIDVERIEKRATECYNKCWTSFEKEKLIEELEKQVCDLRHEAAKIRNYLKQSLIPNDREKLKNKYLILVGHGSNVGKIAIIDGKITELKQGLQKNLSLDNVSCESENKYHSKLMVRDLGKRKQGALKRIANSRWIAGERQDCYIPKSVKIENNQCDELKRITSRSGNIKAVTSDKDINPFMDFFKLLEKERVNDFLNLDVMAEDGIKYSLLSLYLSDIVSSILNEQKVHNQELQIKMRQSLDLNEQVFLNSVFRQSYIERQALNEKGQASANKETYVKKLKDLLVKYRLMWVSYARHISGAELKMGLFTSFLPNDSRAIIVALSNNASAFELTLTKKDRVLRTQATPLASAFFDILSIWMGDAESFTLPHSQGIDLSFNKLSLGYILNIPECKREYERQNSKNLTSDFLKLILSRLKLHEKRLDFYSSGIHPLFVNFFLQYISDQKFPISTEFSLVQNGEVKRPLFTSSLPLVREGNIFKDPISGVHVEANQTISNLSWELQNKNFRGLEKTKQYYRLKEERVNNGHINKGVEKEPKGVFLWNSAISIPKEEFERVESQHVQSLYCKLQKPQDYSEEDFFCHLSSLTERVTVWDDDYNDSLSATYPRLFSLMAKIAKYAYPSFANRGNWIFLMLYTFLDNETNREPKRKAYFKKIEENFGLSSFFVPIEKRQFVDIPLTQINSVGNGAHEICITVGKYVKPIHLLLASMPWHEDVETRERWPILKGIINLTEWQEGIKSKKEKNLNYENIKYYGVGQKICRVGKYYETLLQSMQQVAEGRKEKIYEDFLKKEVPIFHRFPVKDFSMNKECLVQCLEHYNKMKNSQGAVLVHCRSGVGRTGMVAMFIILDSLYINYMELYRQEGIRKDKESFLSDVYSYLFLLRMARSVYIVQSETQADLLMQIVEDLWRKLEQFYSKNQAKAMQDTSNSPLLLGVPSYYSSYPCSILKENFVTLKNGFGDLKNVIVFVPNYLFIAQRSQHGDQKDHLPFYLPVFPKALEESCFDQDNFQFIQQYFLFAFLENVLRHKGTSEKKTLASIYHPFLLMLNRGTDTFSHLYDRIFFVITEILMEMVHRRDFDGLYEHDLRCCNGQVIKNRLMQKKTEGILKYYQKHFYDLFSSLLQAKVSVYPLHVKIDEFPSFFDRNFYERLLSKIRHKDQERQFVVLCQGEVLHDEWRKSGEDTLRNTSVDHVRVERYILEQRMAQIKNKQQ